MRFFLFLIIFLVVCSSKSFAQTRRSSATSRVVEKKPSSEKVQASKESDNSAAKGAKKTEVVESESFLNLGLKDKEKSKVVDQKLNDSAKKTISSANVLANTPANTSAIAHGEASRPNAAVAKIYKYKAEEQSVDYYNELRKKFEVDEKARKEKEAQLAVENAKKEEEIKQGRRLAEDKAPQFDRFRQGEKNVEVKKTTAEEDYKNLFK